ncbi:hypothetical protein [Burkholderia gladioli]|uniref:hypothetical protein n=1 Tax=Burkholderia gladioli TaxID=28095 RepID=UPI00163E2251|nr:hypothetical protein [Burkholderia gladioli]
MNSFSQLITDFLHCRRLGMAPPKDRPVDGHIPVAAKMVGEWWADRLYPEHVDKRVAFVDAVSMRVEQVLRGEICWTEHGREVGNGQMPRTVFTECDYDPGGLLLEAVREVIDPMCGRGLHLPAAYRILSGKHALVLDTQSWLLKPREGYQGWTSVIPVPVDAR